MPSTMSLCADRISTKIASGRKEGRDPEYSPLPVDEPLRDLELARVLHDGDDTLKLVGVELTSTVVTNDAKEQWEGSVARSGKMERSPNEDEPLGEVNVGLLADEVGVTTTNTLDLGQGVLREA